jgi:hypothetical protein
VTGQGQGADGRGVDDGAADHRGDYAADYLRDPVTDGLTDPDPPADQRPHGHGRVVVAARDVAAGVNHDHQGRARRQRGKHAVAEHAHHDDERQEERPDRLDRVLADFRRPCGDGSNCHRFRLACDDIRHLISSLSVKQFHSKIARTRSRRHRGQRPFIPPG